MCIPVAFQTRPPRAKRDPRRSTLERRKRSGTLGLSTAEVTGGIVSTTVDGDQTSSPSAVPARERVSLLVEADVRLASVIRVLGTGLAARLGFDVAGVEDIRLALDELSLVLMEHAGPASTLRLDFGFDTERLSIEAYVDPRPAGPPLLDPLARQVLSAVASEVVVADAGQPKKWLELHFEPERTRRDRSSRRR